MGNYKIEDESTVGMETIGAATTVEGGGEYEPEKKEIAYRRLSNMVDVGAEQAKELVNLSESERRKKADELGSLISKFKFLMFLMAANVGWANYTINVIPFYSKNDLQLSAVEVGKIVSITTIPWSIKPIWGFVIDSFSFFGYRFKSDALIMGALSFLAGAAFIINPQPSKNMLTLIIFFQTLTASYLDSMAQGMTALITKLSEKQINLQDPDLADKSPLKVFGLYNSFKSLVRTVLTFIGGYVVQKTQKTHLFYSGIIMGGFPLIFCIATIFLFKEEKGAEFSKGVEILLMESKDPVNQF